MLDFTGGVFKGGRTQGDVPTRHTPYLIIFFISDLTFLSITERYVSIEHNNMYVLVTSCLIIDYENNLWDAKYVL